MTGDAERFPYGRYSEMIFAITVLVGRMTAIACQVSFPVQQEACWYIHARLHIHRMGQPYSILMTGDTESAYIFCKQVFLGPLCRIC